MVLKIEMFVTETINQTLIRFPDRSNQSLYDLQLSYLDNLANKMRLPLQWFRMCEIYLFWQFISFHEFNIAGFIRSLLNFV